MTGIHRPERCLEAQGWQVGERSKRTINVPGLGPMELMRLHNKKNVPAPDGRPFQVQSICYYWFIGHSSTVASHEARVWIDMRDRILKGYNQRWGMVLINSEITKDRQRFGRDERQTDMLLDEFIKRLAPKLIKTNAPNG